MSTEQASLSDILKRDEQGRFASIKTEPVAAEPQSPNPDDAADPAVPEIQEPAQVPPPSPTGDKPGPSPVPEKVDSDEVRALKAELARRTRQNRIDAAQAAPPEPTKPPSVFEDEEGFANSLEARLEAKSFDRYLAKSERSARKQFSDFEQVMGTDGTGTDAVHLNWIAAVQANPQLYDQFKDSDEPAEFAYAELKRQAALKEIGDPVSYREKLRKEIEAEILAKAGGTVPNGAAQTAPKPEQVLPDTLAGSKSVSSRDAPEFSGPKPLSDIFASAPHMTEMRRR
jgi:hypothetical protein